MKTRLISFLLLGASCALCAGAEVKIDTAMPGGCLAKAEIDGDNVHLTRDYRDTQGGWFYWAFRVAGAEGRTLNFDFPGVDWAVGSRGAAVSLDRGKSWRWMTESEFKPLNSFS